MAAHAAVARKEQDGSRRKDKEDLDGKRKKHERGDLTHRILTGADANKPSANVSIHDALGGGQVLTLMQAFGRDQMSRALLLSSETLPPATRKALAATMLQRSYRAYKIRKRHAAWYHKVNLVYECAILRERKRRRGLLVGFLQRTPRPSCRAPSPPSAPSTPPSTDTL